MLTDEPANLSAIQLRDADKVRLGELQPSNGDVMFEFVLKNKFETSHGNQLTIAFGDSFQVFAWQRTPGGSHAVGAGWLDVH
ncbi:MAG: hypothetical protein WBD55_03840 [Dehalococcoidia bacterium]